jgi:hypothetical protein
VEEIERMLSEFHTKEIEEKFLEGDVLTVRAAPQAQAEPQLRAQSPPPPPRPNPPPKREPLYVVVFDYNPSVTEEGMMPIFVGEVLTVTDKSDPDWWMAKKPNGQVGWVPGSYLKQQ